MTKAMQQLIKEAVKMHNWIQDETPISDDTANELGKLLIANGAIAASIDGEGFLKVILPEDLH